MAITANAAGGGVESATSGPRTGSLADVLDVILDKGIVIDAFVRVSLVGIEILTIDARIVVASVDTYMHFAREAHRLEMGGGQGSAKKGLAGMMGKLEEGGAHSMARGALQGAGEGVREGLLPHRKQSDDQGGVVQRAVGAIKDKAGGAIRETFSSDDDGEGDEGTQGGSAAERSPAQGSRANASSSERQQRGRRAGTGRPRAQEGGSEGPGGSGASRPEGGSRRRAGPAARRPPPSRAQGD